MKFNKVFLISFYWAMLLSCGSPINKEEEILPPDTQVTIASSTQKAIATLPAVTATQNILVTSTNIPDTLTPDGSVTSHSLQEAMLTKEDITAIGQSISLQSYIPDEFLDNNASIIDVSQELPTDCLLDCTKQVWSTVSHEVTGFGGNKIIVNMKVIIVMFLSESEDGARIISKDMYNDFLPFAFEYDTNDYPWVNAGNTDTYIGFDVVDNRAFIAIFTSRNSVSLMVISYPHPLSDDGIYNMGVAVDFANIQLQKLEQLKIILPPQ